MTTAKGKNVLLTAGRSYITLDLARKFHAVGHRVVVVESTKDCVSAVSGAVDRFYITPAPRFEQEAYIDFLTEIIRREQIDMLIPVWEDVLYISQYLDRFPDSCEVFCDPFEVLEPLHNKWSFNEKLKAHGFDFIPAKLIRHEDELEQLDMDVPYAFKQVYSRASQKVSKVIPPALPPSVSIPEHNPWMAQEWMDGDKYCSYAVCHKGKVYAYSVYPVEVAIDGHSCLSFRPVEHAGIATWIQRFVGLENFTGQISFDFIETKDGRLLSFECNPRATSGAHLFSNNCGLDRAFFRENEEVITADFSSQRQLLMAMLLYGWTSPFCRENPRQYLKHLLRSHDVVKGRGDLRPLLLSPKIFWRYWRLSRFLGVSIPAAFTHDLDWNAEPA